MPFRLGTDQSTYLGRYRLYSQPLTDQLLHILEGHHIQLYKLRLGPSRQFFELWWHRPTEWARVHSQEQWTDLLINISQQRPGSRIEPVQIFKSNQKRRCACFFL